MYGTLFIVTDTERVVVKPPINVVKNHPNEVPKPAYLPFTECDVGHSHLAEQVFQARGRGGASPTPPPLPTNSR